MQSSDFFLENTEESLKPAPVFQAQMILNATEIQFKSSLDKKAGDGFYDLRWTLGWYFLNVCPNEKDSRPPENRILSGSFSSLILESN